MTGDIVYSLTLPTTDRPISVLSCCPDDECVTDVVVKFNC
jgi:hypothetical protein